MADFANEIKSRIRLLQKWMSKENINAVYLTPGDNFYYSTGFNADSMERLLAAVITQERSIMISPLMLEEQVGGTPWPGEVVTWKDGEDPYKRVLEVFTKNNIKTLAVERRISYSDVLRFKKMGVRKFKFSDDVFNSWRIIKSKNEIEFIRTAVKSSEASYQKTLEEIHKGITEVELAGILEYNFKLHSLQSLAFESIVAFGENAGIPHHIPSDRKLRSGDVVLIDFGGKYMGYSSDTTRTCAYDKIQPKMRAVYGVVKEAQESALQNITRDSTYNSIDKTARDLITKRGYGEYFTHRLGHGLGIAVHEEPYLNSINKQIIQKGAVFTIEPGIYLKGVGGVRIEDTVTFDGKKAFPFNELSKELAII
ncbi:MAG: M24 family metallopeptidase [Thermoplasmata archaeon]